MTDVPPELSAIDPALLQEFLSEGLEILDGLDPLFVSLENDPDDMSIVDGIFRPVHSVKGNSGFFGLTNIKNFAHIMENILGEIRNRKRQATPPLIDLLLKGVDFLRGMMVRLSQGDLTGKFTPEEEAHLELLNKASSAEAMAAASAEETPEAKAKGLLQAMDDLKANRDDDAAFTKVTDSLKAFIHATLPDFFKAAGDGAMGAPSKIAYRIGTTDITGPMHVIDDFISHLAKFEQEEAMCEAFLTALDCVHDAGEKSNPGIPPLVDQIRDDFVTIHNSGIGFDDLMASLIVERRDAILKLVEKVEVGGGQGFLLGGEDVTEAVESMNGFISDLIANDRDKKKCDEFLSNLTMIKDLAAPQSQALNALEQLQDDFCTIHESGIGFDDLMKSLIDERMTAVLASLDRGAAKTVIMKVGDQDVSAPAAALSAFKKYPPDEMTKADKAAKFCAALQAFCEAGSKQGIPDLVAAAEGLSTDFASIQQSGEGVDPEIAAMISGRIGEILGFAKKTVEPPPAVADSKDGKAAAPAPSGDHGASGSQSSKAPAEAKRGGGAASGAAAGGGGHGDGGASGKTLRVAEEKVDNFMNFVGELIIAGEVFAYIQKKLEQYPETRKVAQEFKNANLSFGELSSNLQKSLMEVRRVPLKSTLQKLPRIIRDTSTQLGKKIELEIVGEDVQIDKSLLEGLESPLVHMVRNSVDHGVEVPEERKAAGKSEVGHVWITAKTTEEQFTLSIKDDGKGLDVEAIKAKAVQRGLLTEDTARTMPDKEAFRLVFNPGLSTAKVVTDVSGRGVGMDVVLSNITKMNGNINIESVKGQGSVFSIVLPMTVTLSVIDGLVARIGDQQYIIPLSDVSESMRPTRQQIHTIKGGQEIMNVRGVLHPIVHLNQVLGLTCEAVEDPCQATVVLVHGPRGVSAAFVVDEIIGQQSVVVKDLGKDFENIKCLRGGSILGDGRVGLVLDVTGILVYIGAAKAE